MSTRSCSCCRIAGHTVAMCNDAESLRQLRELMNDPDLPSALLKVASMRPGVVSFCLTRGFHVPISGKKARLRQLVIDKFAAHTPIAPTLPTQLPTPATLEMERKHRWYTALLIRTTQFNFNLPVSARCLTINAESSFSMERTNEEHANFTRLIITKSVETLLTTYIRTSRRVLPAMASQESVDLYVDLMLENIDDMTSFFAGILIGHSMTMSPAGMSHMVMLALTLNHNRVMMPNHTDRFPFESIPAGTLILQQLRERMQRERQQREQQQQQTMKVLQIAVKIVGNKVESQCNICFDDMGAEDVVKTQCEHTFCAGCVGGHAAQRGIRSFIRCPCCRADIVELTVACETSRAAVAEALKPVINL